MVLWPEKDHVRSLPTLNPHAAVARLEDRQILAGSETERFSEYRGPGQMNLSIAPDQSLGAD